jgi:hypothetical protein
MVCVEACEAYKADSDVSRCACSDAACVPAWVDAACVPGVRRTCWHESLCVAEAAVCAAGAGVAEQRGRRRRLRGGSGEGERERTG